MTHHPSDILAGFAKDARRGGLRGQSTRSLRVMPGLAALALSPATTPVVPECSPASFLRLLYPRLLRFCVALRELPNWNFLPSAAVPPCAGRLRDMLLALGVATGVERRLSTAARGMGSGLCNVKTELLQL